MDIAVCKYQRNFMRIIWV